MHFTLLFLNIGTPEMMLIMFVALLLFGGKKLPELARGLGKGIREFQDASESVKTEIHRNINAVNDDLTVDMEAAKNAEVSRISETTESANHEAINEVENHYDPIYHETAPLDVYDYPAKHETEALANHVEKTEQVQHGATPHEGAESVIEKKS